ncbi:nitrate reductase gamma subunit [Streptoalloteichus tenebrarius]|uniref:Nitrate reductase gamma subunit n=1 Tax=Streptoalloteichus tenebrarius (strain ATCC 17920 / DSM 40477 / JCM 4838 / CBS 697.72 / NBRC 16177 / NCIMB 11028 / NRRL B-12390 / A12253. 1 / ISP 5477) TaxID=1933 RepID=A0ABT1HRS8_STRSD|nr:respiratory nitrate reductase subunit gamma [Streptoalloteichus tenebrarius]MCP2258223.1 nitrate reductase gamma subunit [Streptoalloteichus tenebrarius]BFF04547.1 respiratory nitrate reductase subunit gamma [Streptoalloteichus tenebrarius]
MISTVDLMLWLVLPYVTIAVLVGGTVWRFRHDRFGLSTRSSQLHESRVLRVASPLFHFGLLFVVGGHVFGLLVPKSVTRLLGLGQEAYHVLALVMGTVAGLAAVGGLAALIWRRWGTPAVRAATTRNDRLTYLLLVVVLLAGMATTDLTNGVLGEYDYRETVSPWFRGILLLHPDPTLMASVPLTYKVHVLAGMVLFCLWPFSRLIHAFTAPVHYLFRPYVVYRSRGEGLGTREPRRGRYVP